MASKRLEELIARLAEPGPEPAHGQREYEHALWVHAHVKHRAATRLLALMGPEAYLDEPRILLALDDSRLEYDRRAQQVRTRGMMERLTHVPEYLVDMLQLTRAVLEQHPSLTASRGKLSGVKVYGVGGSAAPAAIAKEIIANSGRLGFSFEVVRRDAPPFNTVQDDTLLIFSSFSGNTEETLHCLRLALESGRSAGRMIAMSTRGRLQRRAEEHGIPWVGIPRRVLEPRESVALQLVAILTIISALELPSGTPGEKPFRLDDGLLQTTARQLGDLADRWHWEVPFRENEAKQTAAKLLYGNIAGRKAGAAGVDPWLPRIPIILSSASNEAVAYEFYTQLCEAAKLLCHVATCPEALHNLTECLKFGLVSGRGVPWSLTFMESDDDELRVVQRWRHTLQRVFPDVESCSFRAEGESPFARSMSMYYFSAWLRLYMAFLNGAEPRPVPTMSYMKAVMEGISRCSSD